jgi:ABC-type uncharacterized transport system permease subunit
MFVPAIPALLVAAAYAALGVSYARRLRAGRERVGTALVALTAIAVLGHGALLALTLPHAAGMDVGFGSAASATAALVMLGFVILRTVQPVDALGALLLPAAAVSVLLALLPESAPPLRVAGHAALVAHILLSLAAYALLALAALQALLLAYQDRHLRAHDPGPPLRTLPPLWDMERVLFRLIGAGFVTLSLALLTGFAFLQGAFSGALAQKTALSLLAWLVFGALLAGRRFAGWRGQRAARLALAGFGLLLAAYLGSKLLAEFVAA